MQSIVSRSAIIVFVVAMGMVGAVADSSGQSALLSEEKVSSELRSLYQACERIGFRIHPEPIHHSTAQALGLSSADSLRALVETVRALISDTPLARSINTEVFLDSYMLWTGTSPDELVQKFGNDGFHISNWRDDGEGLWTLLVQFPIAQLPEVSTDNGFIGLAPGAQARPASKLNLTSEMDLTAPAYSSKKNSAIHR